MCQSSKLSFELELELSLHFAFRVCILMSKQIISSISTESFNMEWHYKDGARHNIHISSSARCQLYYCYENIHCQNFTIATGIHHNWEKLRIKEKETLSFCKTIIYDHKWKDPQFATQWGSVSSCCFRSAQSGSRSMFVLCIVVTDIVCGDRRHSQSNLHSSSTQTK